MNSQINFSNGCYFFAVGGIEEIGKNCYLIVQNGKAIMVDCGLMFPSQQLPSVDYVIADYSFIAKNNIKVLALFITHGHEDHIGGIPHLLDQINIPVIYAPPLAKYLIDAKFEDANKNEVPVRIYEEGDFKVGEFIIRTFNVTHSIPDSYGLAIRCAVGTILYSGDYKIDFTPIGNQMNLRRLVKICTEEDILLYLTDSTNALIPGYTLSERAVADSIDDIFEGAPGRILIATFSSNVYRIQQIVNSAYKHNRKILIYGRSMVKVVNISRQLGQIKIPDNYLLNPNELASTPDNEVLILCTGSQGEPLAVLSRVANNTHREIKIKPNDTVIFSSNPIPGNALSVSNTINSLTKLGAIVLTNSASNLLHASGHGSQEELKLMLTLIQPKFFLPVHGEYMMLLKQKELALQLGMDPNHIILAKNNDVYQLTKDHIAKCGEIDIDEIYIESTTLSKLHKSLINDRNDMRNNGVLYFFAAINSKLHKVYRHAKFISKGFLDYNDNRDFIFKLQYRLDDDLKYLVASTEYDESEVKKALYTSIYDTISEVGISVPKIIITIHDIATASKIIHTTNKLPKRLGDLVEK